MMLMKVMFMFNHMVLNNFVTVMVLMSIVILIMDIRV